MFSSFRCDSNVTNYYLKRVSTTIKIEFQLKYQIMLISFTSVLLIFVIMLSFVLEFGGSIDVAAITDFIDNGGNVLVAGSSAVGMY